MTDHESRGCVLTAAAVRCPPPADRFEQLSFGRNATATAEPGSAVVSAGGSAGGQIGWQCRAVAVLGRVLVRAAAEDLPPITWTLGGAGMVLAGRFGAARMDQRCADFNTWRLAVGRWAGKGADIRRDHADRAGTVRLVDQWDQFEGITVTLSADIYAED
jgi:hypothetical protein